MVRTGTNARKSPVKYTTQLAGGVVLKKLKHF